MAARRIRIDVLRHAQPLKDPATRESLDCLAPEGMAAAIEKGKNYRDYDGDIIFYHSQKDRARQTVDGIQVGLSRETKYQGLHDGLGFDFYNQALVKLQGAYGPAVLQAFVDANPDLPQQVDKEIGGHFLTDVSMLCYELLEENKLRNPLVIGVSHAPKVEIAYGMLRGLPLDSFGTLAAQPLEGFQLYIDQTSNGGIAQVDIRYKQGNLENITEHFFA